VVQAPNAMKVTSAAAMAEHMRRTCLGAMVNPVTIAMLWI